METGFPLFPEQASAAAAGVDGLFLYCVVVSVVLAFGVFSLVLFFGVKYRRRRPGDRAVQGGSAVGLEIVWILVPLGLTLVMFVWGARLYFSAQCPPPDALEIYVVGKQWMWKLHHGEGLSEINELHVPLGRPVKLTMVSQDVIHSFFVPAFRMKQDVLPGRYTTAWFRAVRTGEYRLFCSQYCGTDHSRMTGRVIVMEPSRYQEWLSGGREGETLAQAGSRLFEKIGCRSCHRRDSPARGPALEGIFGRTVLLRGGGTVVADEAYLRESILDPARRVAAGYEPIMPTYRGQLSEEDLLKLIEYVKSTGTAPEAGADR